MAKVLEQMPLVINGRCRRYSWDDWLDGRVWELKRGEDFSLPVTSFCQVVRTYAHRRQLAVKVVKVDEHTIVIQASNKKQAKPK